MNRLTKRRFYSELLSSINRRQKATGLPPVGPHATDTSIPAVAAAIAKRERKAKKLHDCAYSSWYFNNTHNPDRLNPFYIAQ